MSIKFSATIQDDLPQINEWLIADESKVQMAAQWWLTGMASIVAGCVEDSSGPVIYFRMDKEEENARLHVLFGAPEEVSHKRIAMTMLEGMPKINAMARSSNIKNIIVESKEESLVNFLTNKLGFTRMGETTDYVLSLGGV